jgi:hypothetical protein
MSDRGEMLPGDSQYRLPATTQPTPAADDISSAAYWENQAKIQCSEKYDYRELLQAERKRANALERRLAAAEAALGESRAERDLAAKISSATQHAHSLDCQKLAELTHRRAVPVEVVQAGERLLADEQNKSWEGHGDMPFVNDMMKVARYIRTLAAGKEKHGN